MKTKLCNLKTELNNAKEEKFQIERNLGDSSESAIELNSKIQTLETLKEETTTKLDSMTAKVSELNTILEEKESQIKKTESKIEEFKLDISQLNEKLSGENVKNSELLTNLNDLVTTTAEKSFFIIKNLIFSKQSLQIKSLNEKIEQQNEQITEKTGRVSQLEEENGKLSTEIEAAKSDSSMKDLLDKVKIIFQN